MIIRPATIADAEQILSIYAPIVEQSIISFELAIPVIGDIEKRIAANLKTHDWLVLDGPDCIEGYAYGCPHRPREAYKYSVEVSVYVAAESRGRGIASRLYDSLFDSLQEKGFHSAFAGIALPNDPSERFHQSSGFERIGVFSEIGRKFDQWHDVAWWQRKI